MKKLSIVIFLVCGLMLITVGQTQAILIPVGQPLQLQNGDFETGDLTGWTTFTTTNGTLGTGFPQVVLFDVDQDGSSSLAAAFRVGRVDIDLVGRAGGGIYQDIYLYAGQVDISVDIAVLDNSGGPNADGGLFELLFDGIVVDNHDFGSVQEGVTESSMLFSTSITTAGIHELRIRMGRDFLQAADTPVQYIDDITVQQPVPEPSTMLLIGAGLIGLLGVGRKKLFRP